MARIRHLLPLAVLVVVLAGACTGDENAASDTDGAAEETADTFAAASATTMVATDEMANADQDTADGASVGSDAPAAAGDGEAGSGASVVPAALAPQDIGRDIVFTGDIEIAVADVTSAAGEALRSVERVGGLLFGQETSADRTQLIFKVAPADFQAVLRGIAGLGELRSQSVTADDVTERIVDLESRIATAERSVERLNQFLAEAPGLAEVATLEAQLLERETVLEQLRGQLRTVQNQVSLATIVVTITELRPAPAVELTQTAYLGHDAGLACPAEAELTANEGDEATVCYVISNTGNAALADIEVSDDALDLDPADLIAVSGDPTRPLAPGESVVVAVEVTLDESVRPVGSVTAQPVDDDGEPLATARVGQRAQVDIDVAADDSLPGLGRALSAGWSAFVTVLTLLALGLAVALPFLWIIPVAALIAWLIRRRQLGGPAPVRTEDETLETADA